MNGTLGRRMSPNFALKELVPRGHDPLIVPVVVLAALECLCLELLEPIRAGIGLPVFVNSAYRPPAYNAAVPFSSGTSDHMTGRAADIHLPQGDGRTWEQNTELAARWARKYLDGKFGQLILEDHRAALGRPSKLWVHIALPSNKHPGTDVDPNRLLVSRAPRSYEPWIDQVA